MQKQILYHPSGKPNLEFMYRCLIDIAAGMDYLHSLGVINGDLKPANVLLKSTHEDARGFTCKVRPSILKHPPSVVFYRPFLLVTICGRPLTSSSLPCASLNLLICRRRLQN
jgi:serine/threonine protein kinase